MRKIYVVNGLPLSGKTKLGELVGEELSERGINFLHTSSINPVKAILRSIDTWDPELRKNHGTILDILKKAVTNQDWDGVTKDEYWRRAMSDLKLKMTEWNPHILHGLVLDQFKRFRKDYVGFVDIREPRNIEAFKTHCLDTVVGIQVEKMLVVSDRSVEFSNFSDANVKDAEYDIIFENPRSVFVDDSASLWFLKARARSFVDQEILEGRTKERFY